VPEAWSFIKSTPERQSKFKCLIVLLHPVYCHLVKPLIGRQRYFVKTFFSGLLQNILICLDRRAEGEEELL
jgi:hypothetical protein